MIYYGVSTLGKLVISYGILNIYPRSDNSRNFYLFICHGFSSVAEDVLVGFVDLPRKISTLKHTL